MKRVGSVAPMAKTKSRRSRLLKALPIAMLALMGCSNGQEKPLPNGNEMKAGQNLREIVENSRFRPESDLSLSYTITFLDQGRVIYESHGEAILYDQRFYSLENDYVIVYNDHDRKNEIERIRFFTLKIIFTILFFPESLRRSIVKITSGLSINKGQEHGGASFSRERRRI